MSDTDTQADPVPAKDRVNSTIEGSIVTLTLGSATLGTYDLAAIPATLYPALATIALRDMMIRAGDREKTYAALVAGNVPGKKAAAPKQLDPWRQAWAHAVAEKTVKDAGGKPYIGKNPTPEFKMALDDAMQRAVTIDRDALKKAKVNPAVVTHYARITGSGDDLA